MEAERTTYFAGALAARLLATLARVFGDRIFSMRFVFPALMISIGAIAAAYIIEFLRVPAAEHMLCKYAFVLGAALGALLLAALRGVRAGLCVFVLVSALSCALDHSRVPTYGLLLLFALPGIALNAISLSVSRWVLTRAVRSARASAWLMALLATPLVGAYLCAALSSTASMPTHRFSSFAFNVGVTQAAVCSLATSAIVIAVSAAACLRVALHGFASRRAHVAPRR